MRILPAIVIRPFGPADRVWAECLLTERWAGPRIVSRGVMHDALQLPGRVALLGGEPAGLATFRVVGLDCELVTLDSLQSGCGVGTALISAVQDAARVSGCQRLWLVTTNDNTAARHFFRRRGFRVAAIHRDALEISRRLKPEIPRVGLHGIPLRDEIELELPLGGEAG
jgi:GNAT superfamily N-acetyltransferase